MPISNSQSSSITLQDVVVLMEINAKNSEQRHDDLKSMINRKMEDSFKRLDNHEVRIEGLEKNRPLISTAGLKWVALIIASSAITATVTAYIGGLINVAS